MTPTPADVKLLGALADLAAHTEPKRRAAHLVKPARRLADVMRAEVRMFEITRAFDGNVGDGLSECGES